MVDEKKKSATDDVAGEKKKLTIVSEEKLNIHAAVAFLKCAWAGGHEFGESGECLNCGSHKESPSLAEIVVERKTGRKK